MAYVQAKTRGERLASAGMVAALHIGIGAALVVTFAGGVRQAIDTAIQAVTVTPIRPLEPPPPVPPPTGGKTTETTIDTIKTQIDLPPIGPVIDIGPKLDPIDIGTGADIGTGPGTVLDPPSPSPSFVPRPARPKTSPATWATALDYPPRALREGREGVTAFRVSIGTDGKVTDCMIIRSSGSEDLDAATCAKVSRRATFQPATNDAGDPVTGSYANSIRWEIPE